MPRILVTGGAGYIGSHTVAALTEAGYEVVVLDNLSTGVAGAVLPPARLVKGDLGDVRVLEGLFQKERFSGVIHFAASIVVPESVSRPLPYYENNVVNSLKLIRLAVNCGVRFFVFSSSAAVYGIPAASPVNESAETLPINPYGRTKLMVEWILNDAAGANPEFRYVALRYFNVAGADPGGRLGQNSPDATHLIKVACETALGRRRELRVFGADYDTFDGTCIRDYIHVSDLADVHVKALAFLERNGESAVLNCGYGKGFSVLQVAERVKEASGVDFPVTHAGRRPGDPPQLVADASRLVNLFHWKPARADLKSIVTDALDWEKKRSL